MKLAIKYVEGTKVPVFRSDKLQKAVMEFEKTWRESQETPMWTLCRKCDWRIKKLILGVLVVGARNDERRNR